MQSRSAHKRDSGPAKREVKLVPPGLHTDKMQGPHDAGNRLVRAAKMICTDLDQNGRTEKPAEISVRIDKCIQKFKT